MGRQGNNRNRVPLTDNTQSAKISDSRKIACVVPHYHPLPLYCFKLISLSAYFLSFQGQLKIKALTSYTFLFMSDWNIIRDLSFSDFIPAHLQSKCISLGHRHHMLWCLNTSHALQCSGESAHNLSFTKCLSLLSYPLQRR